MMTKINSTLAKMKLACSIMPLIIFMQLLAQTQLASAQARFIQPTLEQEPENRGAPSDRVGAGSRGNCPAVSKAAVGLVPEMLRKVTQNAGTSTSKFILGLTEAEYPTFWFYIPYTSKQISSVKFVLVDEKDTYVTKEPLPITLSETPGVISVPLPKTLKPLERGKYYHWYLLIDCQPQSRSEDIALQGLVKRVAPQPDFTNRLKTATPSQQVVLYSQQGYWQDAITILGELRRKNPQDAALANDWKELLNSVQLGDVAAEPISPCCTVEK